MSPVLDEDVRATVLEAALKAAPKDEREAGPDGLGPFLRRYYRHVLTEDLTSRSPRYLAELAHAHRELARQRPVGTANVRVFNPGPQDEGWDPSKTIVHIVTDDMPFLVDSISWELNSQGSVRLIIHPQFTARRDAMGTLEEVVDLDEAPRRVYGVGLESWMCLEMTRIEDKDLPAIEGRLRGILSDVRDAVEDWPKMREQARRLATDLRSAAPTRIDPEWGPEAAAFLDWIADDHFTFLGYREYERAVEGGEPVLRATPGSGLGQWRYDKPHPERIAATPESDATAAYLLLLYKDDARSTVHRAAIQDIIAVRRFDESGQVIGEYRFLGLYTSKVFNASVTSIPLVRKRVQLTIAHAGFTPDSHSGRALVQVIEGFPRDELLQTGEGLLATVAPAILHLKERGKTGVFLRRSVGRRFLSALVYIPRDRYTTAVRLRIASILTEASGAQVVDFTTRVNEWSLARLHFVLTVPEGSTIPDIDVQKVEQEISAATRSWDEDYADSVRAQVGEPESSRLIAEYAGSFPEAYKEDSTGEQGIADVLQLEAVRGGDRYRYDLYRDEDSQDDERRFKLYRDEPLSLTKILPLFSHFGVETTDERPYDIERPDGSSVFIYDVGLRSATGAWDNGDAADIETRFIAAVAAVSSGAAQSDQLNELVLSAGLTWRQVVILRTVATYLRQAQSTFSPDYIERALVNHANIALLLVQLFETRFDPARFEGRSGTERAGAEAEVSAEILAALDHVASLDFDRIIRSLHAVIAATVRTNFYQRTAEGELPAYVALKIESRRIEFLPLPKPLFEIWVYSPRVEGVHLRFGNVARGGLRWSDRREDFRTETLGLVKAQTVKNVVIVPTGSKGGFYPKQLPDPAVDRDAWLAEGVAAYKMFISAMLDVTDNLVGGAVVPPADLVRHDPDDPYLVVAADKGTASFSDYANACSQEHGFWLDDAFASGGSAGYDHKGMGITARGAWESVKRHFRELGIDTQTQDFTCVGIGDMSGDVFGNGMQLSEHIRLVAAFDHRHIFVDPTPDAATSIIERRRLFELPRSSWADYDSSLISAGGGVFARSLKSVPVSPQMQAALGIDENVTAMTPAELMRAILKAPVDLLWNGGIGTYIKASFENNAQIGDHANDAIRVDGADLRCAVLGEGGNLGASQKGRIEAAQGGVRLNTDAVDNSAGVDTSDHEVNLKILLTGLMKAGRMTLAERNALLGSMTDDVARQVLRDNYEQNAMLGTARYQAPTMLPLHQRVIADLEHVIDLDRALESLPTDGEITRRQRLGLGLTSPELSALMAHVKIFLKRQVLASDVPDDPWFRHTLAEYFPEAVRSQYPTELLEHPLRREIIVDRVVNSLVNRGGITFCLRAWEETGAAPDRVARAYVISREVFDQASFIAAVEALDNVVSTDIQSQLYLEFRRVMDRSVRWFLANRPMELDVTTEIERFRDGVATMARTVPSLLRGAERDRFDARVAELVAAAVPEDLAARTASLLDGFSLLDSIGTASATSTPLADVVAINLHVSEQLMIDAMLTRVSELPRTDKWDAMARGAMRDDLYAVQDQLTRAVLASSTPGGSPSDRMTQWTEANAEALTRARTALAGVDLLEKVGLAPLSVVLRTLRTIAKPIS